MIHEDERRTLEDWPEAKIITAKQDCVLGDHYHTIKTERFVLTRGEGTITRSGIVQDMVLGKLYKVQPGVRHSFYLTMGSVLIGLCSHKFDPSDDYR